MVQHADIDHTGVTGVSGNVAADTIWDAAGDMLIGTGANTGTRLAKGTAGQGLVAGATTLSWVDILPWHHFIPTTIATPDATTGTWVSANNPGSNDSGFAYPFYVPGSTANSGSAQVLQNTSGAQNDAWALDLIMAAGTWDAHFWIRKSTNTGIITLNEDGASKGTVDTYAAAAAAAKVSITGWTIATTGKKRMQILMATKNASSSNYFVSIFGIEFRRTA